MEDTAVTGAPGRGRVLFFETHPIQYRAPVFQALQRLVPDRFEVIYASDFSVRGTVDRDFGRTVSWDTPLLEGYPYRVLGNEGPGGGERFGGLTGEGIDRLIGAERPAAVVLHALFYRYSLAVYFAALRRRIPIWYRCDTNDRAFARKGWRSAARFVTYRALYAGLSRALFVGQLNRAHLRRFGVTPDKLMRVPHCVPDPIAPLDDDARAARRAARRQQSGIPDDRLVVGFVGKLIPKKRPDLVLAALRALAGTPEAARAEALFVGSGELEPQLRADADALARDTGVASRFAGFVNQQAITDFYLAIDILVLPSERAGETWGLVVNEALQAGCAVIVSDEVGCAADFGEWERVRVVPAGDAGAIAGAIADLARYKRDFRWAEAGMCTYSVEAVAGTLADLVRDATGGAEARTAR